LLALFTSPKENMIDATPVGIADPNQSLTPAPIAAAPAPIDPNTLIANAPKAAPAAPMGDTETYVDEWAKDPSGNAPVRTWVDPALRNIKGDDGEYVSAWYDGQVDPANVSGLPAHSVEVVAPDPVIEAPVPAPAAAAEAPKTSLQQYWDENAGPGEGGGAPGDGGPGGGGPGSGGSGGTW
jgi:hypothetical protein